MVSLTGWVSACGPDSGTLCRAPGWRSIMRRTRGPPGPECSARNCAGTLASSWVRRLVWRRYSSQVGVS